MCVSIIIIIFITFLFNNVIKINKKNYETQLKDANSKIICLTERCAYFENEYKKLKNYKRKKEKLKNVSIFDTPDGKIKKISLYEGKKALIGDYTDLSFFSEKVLQSFGFEVDIAKSCKELINKVKFEEKYDIIFTNNLYEDGNGIDCLHQLKKIKNFSTPIIMHTVSIDERDYYVNVIGFDDYIVKPLTQEKLKPILEKLLKETQNYIE